MKDEVEDRAKVILNICKEKGVDLNYIDYNKLEELLIKANRVGNIKFSKISKEMFKIMNK